MRALIGRAARLVSQLVAGEVALNVLIASPRRSQDIDLFHDTEEALASTWAADFRLLQIEGFAIRLLREVLSFVEAMVPRGPERAAMQ